MKVKINKIKYELFGFLFGLGIILAVGGTIVYAAVAASIVTYDNSSSSLSSTNVQGAIDELNTACTSNLKIYITRLYNNASKSTITTASDEVIVQASSVGLMKDSAGNIRYYGADPANYVTFNGESASWRIIGIVDGKVKIVRTIGFPFQSSTSNLLSFDNQTTNYGSPNWKTSRLMMTLNPDSYTDSSISSYGATYWNRVNGTCYGGTDNVTVSCDFSSTGLTTTAQNMISPTNWYLGSANTVKLYPNDMYSKERDTSVYTTWYGYVGLMYASDYAYASDLNSCKEMLSNYDNDSTNCVETNWFYANYTNGYWTISGSYGTSGTGFSRIKVTQNGDMLLYKPNSTANLRPSVFLKSNIKIVSGSGTSGSPYVLS